MKPIPILVLVHSIVFAQMSIDNIKDRDGNVYKVKTMADDKLWTIENLRTKLDGSHCYDDKNANCDAYGCLYTWGLAKEGCKILGPGWRLPSNDEWQRMIKYYGGVWDDSQDDGKQAFGHLINGGDTQFNVLLGGGKSLKDGYARIEAHGFYWSSTETGEKTAWLYNFGKNLRIINRHDDTEKAREMSVRCMRDRE